MNDRKSTLPYSGFEPIRIASWWGTIDDLLWPQQHVIDRIKRRAEQFSKAGIDTAINFGFHMRFDFSNYFGSLHGYLAEVSQELQTYGIRFMDHYSCNLLVRPRGEQEFRKMHHAQRHHVLLHPDPIAAEHAQYAGYRFQDLCQVDVRDRSRGYSWRYQTELLCHNNPNFLDMHAQYLKRLISEVPMDAIEVDDMLDYGGLSTCGCEYCLKRFRRDYGHELPPFGDKSFWGDTSGPPTTWGNYDHPVFRDWIRMKSDSVVDHLKMVKSVIGDLPLMTCCSSTGPMRLNAVGLNLERMSDQLDLFMLENCGTGLATLNWDRMEAEALQQKDIAHQRGHAPAMAISYANYEAGGYLGWALSRFWGVGNWSSTLYGRLPADPEDQMEIADIVGPFNNWERRHSDLDYRQGCDVPDVRLVSNRFCKENGWCDAAGLEHWDRVTAWSRALLHRNFGYRFVRAEELADAEALMAENTPLILDGVACVSDEQYAAIKSYASADGSIWLRLPFGTHDELGMQREQPLSVDLMDSHDLNVTNMSASSPLEAIEHLLASGAIRPRIRQISGDPRWSARLRIHGDDMVLHLMNRGLEGEQHPTVLDSDGNPILYKFKSTTSNEELGYVIDFTGLGNGWRTATLLSPDLQDEQRPVKLERSAGSNEIRVTMDPVGVTLYGVIQEVQDA